jgi:hypothetical protein
MPEQENLPPDVAAILRQLGSAEIVVGLPSYNNVGTIAEVVRCVRQGLREFFPGKRAIIVNTDCGSTDGTAQLVTDLPDEDGVALLHAILPAQDLVMPYHGIPGKSDALRLTLQVARQLGARLCLMLSTDITTVSPSWIQLLGTPILEQGFDFVVPFYARHKLDGAINNSIVRPLVRALYGKQVRQPLGGEYAFSAALLDPYLAQKIWDTDLARLGTDIWTTTQAIRGAFKLCQVHLGIKSHAASAAPADVGTTLTHVLGSLFEDMSQNAAVWQKVRGSQPTPILGEAAEGVPSAASFDIRKLVDSFRLGLRNLQDVWSLVLPPATLLELKRAANSPPETLALPDELWCRVVFDFALAYRLRTLNRKHLLGAFLPLYLGWLGSFALEVQEASNAESERRLERLCQTYETQKPYLISRWRSPDRFNP